MNLSNIILQLRKFAEDRDWDQFHSPKNLAIALSVEASELLEPFQWLTEEESAKLDENKLRYVKAEIADVQIYLIRLADVLGVDIEKAVQNKIANNALKYPVDKFKGNSKKYSEYDDGVDN